MFQLTLAYPPLELMRACVAAVWLYEGVWCKLLGRAPLQRQVVEAVSRWGKSWGRRFLLGLGAVEAGLAVWVMWGVAAGACALAETALLVALNANGLLWARRLIHEPGGMVVKNIAFLMLAWICGAGRA